MTPVPRSVSGPLSKYLERRSFLTSVLENIWYLLNCFERILEILKVLKFYQGYNVNTVFENITCPIS